MKIYQFYRKQHLNVALEDAWDFLSTPHHLNEITPEFFKVEITSTVPAKIYAGLMISYRIKAIGGIPMTWLSEVSHCEELRRFVYHQRVGPFKLMSHEVCFTQLEQGILFEDIIFYIMPFGWLGELFNKLLIADTLAQIFKTRSDFLEQQWGFTKSIA